MNERFRAGNGNPNAANDNERHFHDVAHHLDAMPNLVEAGQAIVADRERIVAIATERDAETRGYLRETEHRLDALANACLGAAKARDEAQANRSDDAVQITAIQAHHSLATALGEWSDHFPEPDAL